MSNDPRIVGGVYRSGYWQKNYTILSISERNGTKWFESLWEDDQITTHCTPWSFIDKIVYQPNASIIARRLNDARDSLEHAGKSPEAIKAPCIHNPR